MKKSHDTGMTLVELLIALGLSAIAVFASLSLFVQGQKAQLGLQGALDSTDFFNRIMSLLDEPERCKKALGEGFSTLSTPTTSNNLDPNLVTAQNITVRDPNDPTKKILFSAFGGPASAAPASAKISNDLIIRKLDFKKRNSPVGAGDIHGILPEVYKELPSNLDVNRRTVLVDLNLEIENVSVPSKRALGAGNFLKTGAFVIQTEQLLTGGVWKISACSTQLPPNTGWNSTQIPSECSTLVGTVNSNVECPEGTYLMMESFNFFASTASAQPYSCGCGKNGCATCSSATTTGTVNTTLTCCPSTK